MMIRPPMLHPEQDTLVQVSKALAKQLLHSLMLKMVAKVTDK
jgi:hypothetical protein